MPKKRLFYLDMAKGVGIFLVVLGHIEYLNPDIQRWISSFHMPLFFTVGGVLIYTKEASETSFKEQCIRRAKGILVPYVSFSLILLTMRTFEYFVQPERITGRELMKEFVESLTGYGIYTLWFLPAYFLSCILFSLLCRLLKEKPYSEWILCLLVFSLAGAALKAASVLGLTEYSTAEERLSWYAITGILIVLLRVLIVLPFFLLGRWYGKTAEGSGKKSALFITGTVLSGAGVYLSGRLPVMDLHYLFISPLHYVSAAVSCAGLLNILKALPKSRVLSYLGQNSLIIMCTHAGMFVVYYVSLGMFFVRKFIPVTDTVLYLEIAVMVCIAEIPIIRIFNRRFKHLLGRT